MRVQAGSEAAMDRVNKSYDRLFSRSAANERQQERKSNSNSLSFALHLHLGCFCRVANGIIG